jgi:uncharacterized protein (DUF697 family)
MRSGLQVRELVGVVRDVRHAASSQRPLAIGGVLAEELARQLSAGGEPGAIRVGGDPRSAAAFMLVVGGEPTTADVRRLRAATRALVPTIAIQLGSDPSVRIPYVLATDVVQCPPGQGFPIQDIASVLARQLGSQAAPLAARLPAIRSAVSDRLVDLASLQTALIGLLPGGRGPRYPVMALAQARLVLDLAAAHGRELGPERATDVAAVAGTGLGLRAVVRRLGRQRSRIIAGATGYAGTRALGEAAIRRFGGRRSFRPERDASAV